MVLGVKARGEGSVWRGGRHRIEGVVVECFEDLSRSLFFKVEPLPYMFYFHLLAPNYAIAVPLPSASIRSNSKLESMHLVNESFGGIASPRYTVEFVSQYISLITYEVYVTTERVYVSLEHENCVTRLRPYVLITQLFALFPVSVLF